MNNLPAGWEWASLQELIGVDGLFTDGDWVESKDQDPSGDVRLVQLADIGDAEFRDRSHRSLTSTKARELRCTYLRPGDILVARMPDPLGRACIYPDGSRPAVTVVDVCVIRPGTSGPDHKWLMYYLNSPSARSQVAKMATGTTRLRISRKNLSRIQVPVPPIAEQRRIVSTLDAYLSRVGTGNACVSQAISATGTVRRSFLSSVMDDPADSNVSIGDLIQESRTGWDRSRAHHIDSEFGWPYLRMNNITSTSELDLENIAATEEQRRQYGVAAGDVLFNNRNSADLVGKVAVADSRVDGWLFNNNIIRLRLEPQIEPRFFALQLTSPGYRDRLVQLRSASTNVAAIYSRDLKACNFWLPSMRVQLKIIEDHDRIISSLTIGRALLSKLSARASKLRKALLAEAFAGSLVQQDPVDEPASVLLDRIYAERVAQPKTGRTRKNNTP